MALDVWFPKAIVFEKASFLVWIQILFTFKREVSNYFYSDNFLSERDLSFLMFVAIFLFIFLHSSLINYLLEAELSRIKLLVLLILSNCSYRFCRCCYFLVRKWILAEIIRSVILSIYNSLVKIAVSFRVLLMIGVLVFLDKKWHPEPDDAKFGFAFSQIYGCCKWHGEW